MPPDPSMLILVGVVLVYLAFVLTSTYLARRAYADERARMQADGWVEQRDFRAHYWHKDGHADVMFGQYSMDKEKR